MVDAVIISDIHLGAHNCRAEDLCSFLVSILDEPPARLVLAGDLFDSFDCRMRPAYWDALALLGQCKDAGTDLVWVRGNHDDDPAFRGAHVARGLQAAWLDEYIFVSGGRRILVIHGDQWDPFINQYPRLTRASDQAYLLLQKLDRSHVLPRFAKRLAKWALGCDHLVEEGAVRHMMKKNCDAVVCGHTHHAVASPPYYNCGTWTEPSPTYLVVSEGVVEVCGF